MPRRHLVPPKKSKRQSWDKDNMANAIKAIKEKKMGLKKAVKVYSVPRTTLQRLSRIDKPVEEIVNIKLGRPPVLPQVLEDELVKYLLIMESKFHGLTRNDVRRMAYQLCTRNNIPHPFRNGEVAGRAWFDHFMSRHRNILSILKPSATSISRANGFNKQAVDNFFNLLEAEFSKHKYPADRVFNVDESGVSVVQSKISRVIGLRGKRQVGALSAAERGSLVTCVFSMSASGIFVPPMLIFPRKNMTDTLMKGAPPGSIGRCHPSGWIQSNLFTDWFNHFVSKTKPSKDDPILLILDGHHTHTKNIDIIDIARENHVTIVSLPPHTTHKLQPLDRSFMGPLKHHYSENIRQWMLHNNRPLGPYDIAELLGNAFLRCQTGELAISGFRVTGIFPVNRKVFSDVDFAPSEDINVQSVTVEALKVSKGRTSKDKPSSQSAQYVHPGTLSPLTTPSARDLAEAGPSGCSSQQSSGLVSPQDVLPIPRPKRKLTNKGPKAMTCAVVTSSPYKRALEEAEEKNNMKTKKKEDGKEQSSRMKNGGSGKQPNARTSRRTNSKTSVKKKLVYENESDEEGEEASESLDSGESLPDIEVGVSVPDDDDAVCLFCEGFFSKDTKGELWVQCIACEMWAHNDCAGCEKDAYVCDFCK